MEQFDVKGMSCAACSARVEKAVSKLGGVSSCTVNLLTNSMAVDGSASEQEIIAAVRSAGYDAAVKGKTQTAKKPDDIKDTETPKILRRLIASLVFLLILMYFSMGHMMLGLPVPPFFEGNHLALGMLQMILSAIVNFSSAASRVCCTSRRIWTPSSPSVRESRFCTARSFCF